MNLSIFIGEKIKELRLAKGLTQSDFADILNITRQSVSRYEKGERKADQDILFSLADHFNISIDYFFPTVEENDILSIYNKLLPARKATVLNFANDQLEDQNTISTIKFINNAKAAANPSTLACGDTEIETQEIDEFTKVPIGSEFKIVVEGDSMEPLIKNGSEIYFKEQETIENGEIAILEVIGTGKEDGIAVKKIFFDYENKKIILHSLNEKYDDRILPGENVKIIGKVLFN